MSPIVGRYVDFAIKAAIVATAISMSVAYLFEKITEAITPSRNIVADVKAVSADPKVKLRLKGLLTTNPAVHYRISFIEEEAGSYSVAAEEITLAIGLLELHGADQVVQSRYVKRLQELKSKQEASKNKAEISVTK